VLNTPEAPFARVFGYSDSAVVLKVRVWCKTEDYWTVYYNMTESIRKCFIEDNVEIPYQKIDVNVVNK